MQSTPVRTFKAIHLTVKGSEKGPVSTGKQLANLYIASGAPWGVAFLGPCLPRRSRDLQTAFIFTTLSDFMPKKRMG